MIIRQSYRLQPNHYQEAQLLSWEDSLRFIWNLSLEFTQYALSSCDYKDIGAYRLSREVTQLKKEAPWLKNASSNSITAVCSNLYNAWAAVFANTRNSPKFKKRGVDRISISEHKNTEWSLSDTHLKFPKIGKIKYVKDRELIGTPKSCSIKQDGSHWYVSIVCHLEDKVISSRTNNPVGIDLGVTKLLADSNGTLIENPKYYTKVMNKLAKAQRSLAKKVKGSNNRNKAKKKVAKVHQKIRFQRKDFLHKLSTTYSKNHGIIIVEDLKINNMAKANKGLARSILDSGWGMFREMLVYKQAMSGGTLIKVNPAYTSQTCSECGCISKENRKTQSSFVCVSCGHTENADSNAAKVILAIGMGNTRKLVEKDVSPSSKQESDKRSGYQV